MRGKGVPTGMPKRKPYIVPRVIQYESEAAYPDRMKAIAKSLREESQRKLSPQFKVEPQYIVVVDTDRKYVEVSDNFCQLIGYQREELVGKRHDDLTAPNTNDVSTVFSLFQGGTETNREVFSNVLDPLVVPGILLALTNKQHASQRCFAGTTIGELAQRLLG